MKKIVCALTVLLLVWQSPALAGEVDILVNILVEKGILTRQDADIILNETRAEAEQARRETIEATREALLIGTHAPVSVADVLPAWIRNTRFRGDFRLRYNFTDRDGSVNRHRARYRLRLGFVTAINDTVDIGFGLRTGGSNPRTGNQDMRRTFETPEMRLDYAYASWRPFGRLELTGGKFRNPLWTPSEDFLWDKDIRPEGITAILNHTIGGIELFMNSGFWILDERADSSRDPFMLVFQPGYTIDLGNRAYFKNALGLYEFTHVKGTRLDYSAGTNTRDHDGNLARDYDAVVVSGELGYKTGMHLIPFVAAYGEYIKNRATGTRDTGYVLGCRFGHQRVAKKHHWQAELRHGRLERDAWLDTFPDSSAYGGATNIRYYLCRFRYALMDSVSVALSYYYSRTLSGRRLSEDNLRVDMYFNF